MIGQNITKYWAYGNKDFVQTIELAEHELHKLFEDNYKCEKWCDLIESKEDTDYTTHIWWVTDSDFRKDLDKSDKITKDEAEQALNNLTLVINKPDKFKPEEDILI